MKKYVPLLFSLLAVPLWADSVVGKITVTKKPGRVVTTGTLSMKTGKMSKLTKTVKNDTEVKVLKPLDIVAAYNRADQTLTVELIDRALTVDEKKWTAVGTVRGAGHAGIMSIQKVACLTVPVSENHGRLEVRGDAELGVYGDTWAMPVSRSKLRLSGSLQRGIRVQTSGQNSDVTSDIRWEFQAEGKVFDPTERAPKYFPALKIGDREVQVQADWSTDGTTSISIPVSARGKKAMEESGGQEIRSVTEIRQLAWALERRGEFSHRDFHLTNKAGTYTIAQDDKQAILSPKDSTQLAEDVRAAARYLGIK
ncbi:hypothetical protein JST97_27480 [bacterium]|nr:hypothetical protein [bacterium]